MSFWKKLFGGKKKKVEKQDQPSPPPTTPTQEEKTNEYQLQWIDAKQNPWSIEILDLQPISKNMLSTSKDPEAASNALSYQEEKGFIFLEQQLPSPREIDADLRFPIDGKLERGVLFLPSTMEHKWAIYFHENKILFVRSWLRQVFVVAETKQENNQLIVHKIKGAFTEDDSDTFTKAVVKFLIHSHALREIVPAPIPQIFKEDTDSAGLWAFSMYGNMAHCGYFEETIEYASKTELRGHSLLHIAIAQKDIKGIEEELAQGANINSVAADNLATVHWSLIHDDTQVLEFLLGKGADPNVKSLEGATSIMNAAQSNKLDHLAILIKYNADVNAQDTRGFTALHRAAEMGHLAVVKLLINQGAKKEIAVEGYTALSLAKSREHTSIIGLLE